MVVVAHESSGTLTPSGILVDSVVEDTFYGRALNNSLGIQAGDQISCDLRQVLDWQFVDAFELAGGSLYRTVYRRLPNWLRSHLALSMPFVIEWDDGIDRDPEFCEFVRDITNLNHAKVAKALSAEPKLLVKQGMAPWLWHDQSGVQLVEVSSIGAAAEFGDGDMMRLLNEYGAFESDEARAKAINRAVIRGNYETTEALLQLGVSVETGDPHNGWPLKYAAVWGHVAIMRLLLAWGANVERRCRSERTALFSASSVDVAQVLLDAGARRDAIDDTGRTSAQRLREMGSLDVADAIDGMSTAIGASHPDKWPSVEEIKRRGWKRYTNYLAKHDPEEYQAVQASQTVDFGRVLPCRAFAPHSDIYI